ncbi:hypothetical protein N7497_011635, partial [Penicillium chrysogenum]
YPNLAYIYKDYSNTIALEDIGSSSKRLYYTRDTTSKRLSPYPLYVSIERDTPTSYIERDAS